MEDHSGEETVQPKTIIQTRIDFTRKSIEEFQNVIANMQAMSKIQQGMVALAVSFVEELRPQLTVLELLRQTTLEMLPEIIGDDIPEDVINLGWGTAPADQLLQQLGPDAIEDLVIKGIAHLYPTTALQQDQQSE